MYLANLYVGAVLLLMPAYKLARYVNFLSNHPIEQKMAAFRFHITKPLNPDKKQTEG